MAQVVWSEPALNDLNEIAEFIALSNPTAARNLVSKVFTKVERLERFPDSGKVIAELPELPFQELLVDPCRVFFRKDGKRVYIIHVMRQERDLRRFLLSHEE